MKSLGSRHIAVLSIALYLLLCMASVASASSRVALVIGNGSYTDTSPLPNARNDGQAMAARLRALDFEVFEGTDLNRGQMQSLISRFSRGLRNAEVGLFFYAGHGMQVDGKNHLVPVNAVIKDDADLPFQTIPMDIILTQMERNVATRLVFLDACRDNPMAKILARSLSGASRSISVDQGLAQMQAGVGTLIAYATEPDAVALDGKGENSPFTSALLKYLDIPGLEIRQLLTRVRLDVLAATDQQQVPWDHSSLTGEFYFVPLAAEPEPEPQPVATVPAPAPPVVVQQDHSIELAFWQSAQQIQDPGARRLALEAYMSQYPEGQFTALAKVLVGATNPGANRSMEPPRAEILATPASSTETPARQEPISEEKAQQVPMVEPTEPASPVASESTSEEKPQTVAMARPPELTVSEPAPVDPRVAAEAVEDSLGLDRSERRRIQRRLTALGFDTRGVDGLFGDNTREAIRGFQESRSFPVTGFLRREQLSRLEDDAAPVLARAAREAETARKADETRARERATRQAEAASTEQQTPQRSPPARRPPPPPKGAAPPPPSSAPPPQPVEKEPNYAFRRCMMNYEKTYSDCAEEHGPP